MVRGKGYIGHTGPELVNLPKVEPGMTAQCLEIYERELLGFKFLVHKDIPPDTIQIISPKELRRRQIDRFRFPSAKGQ